MDKAEKQRLAGIKAAIRCTIAVNAFLLELGGRWALIDAGSGNTMGPTLGKLPDSLRAAGSRRSRSTPSSSPICIPTIPTAWSTTPAGRIYPNAELILHETEARSGSTATKSTAPNDRIRRNIAKAAVSTGPYRERLRTVRRRRGGARRLGGADCPATRPATPAGSSSRARTACLIWGDLVHSGGDPGRAARHRARLRRRSADRLRDAQAHVRPHRGRQARRSPARTWIFPASVSSRAKARASASSADRYGRQDMRRTSAWRMHAPRQRAGYWLRSRAGTDRRRRAGLSEPGYPLHLRLPGRQRRRRDRALLRRKDASGGQAHA